MRVTLGTIMPCCKFFRKVISTALPFCLMGIEEFIGLGFAEFNLPWKIKGTKS